MASSGNGLRISDADRQQAVDELSEQFALGRLTAEEFDERSDAAWSARTRGDLAPLFADLPSGTPQQPVAPPGRGAGRGFRPPAWRGVGRFVVPLVMVLVVLTIITHLPLILLAVGIWFFVGHRRWHHHHGAYNAGYRGGWVA